MQSEALESIKAVVELLEEATQDWWLIGGAAFVTHGVGSGPLKDIDVLIGSADARRIEQGQNMQLLNRGESTLFHRGESTLFRSAHYFSCPAGNVPIEFMADLKVYQKDEWHLLAPKTRVQKLIGGVQVYVPDALELIEIAQLFGRGKDLARAAELGALLVK